MLQVLLCLITVVISLFYLYIRRRFSYWKDRGIPYEEPSVFFGSLSFIMRKSVFDYFKELGQKFPTDYVGAFFGWKPVLIIQTPELSRDILSKYGDNFQNRQCYSTSATDPLGAYNLFTVKNPLWKEMRYELSPMFTSSRLKAVTELMNVNATELVTKIKRDHIDNNEPVCLKDLFSMYTSDTVGSTVFGIKVSALNDPSNPLWFLCKNMVEWTFWRGFEFTTILLMPTLAALLRFQFFSKPASDYIKKLFYDVVRERKATGKSSEKDLVNHLLKLKENMKLPVNSNPQLAEELMLAQVAVFVLGSIETSSSTLCFLLHELAHHPEAQEKLYEEISEALKRTGKDILEYEDLLKMKYLMACILETLRMYPPTTNLDRVCNKTCTLTNNLTIDEGTPVFINIVKLHYDPERFPEPEKWKPERMYGFQETDHLQYSYLPFGAGPRFCIGRRYGAIQVRAALAQIIHKYKLLPDPSEPYQMRMNPYSALMAPISGGRVKFEPR